MDAETISQYEKARTYSQEPERIHVRSLTAEFEGRHHTHGLHYAEGHWSCDCDTFVRRRQCSHALAAERAFGPMAREQLQA